MPVGSEKSPLHLSFLPFPIRFELFFFLFVGGYLCFIPCVFTSIWDCRDFPIAPQLCGFEFFFPLLAARAHSNTRALLLLLICSRDAHAEFGRRTKNTAIGHFPQTVSVHLTLRRQNHLALLESRTREGIPRPVGIKTAGDLQYWCSDDCSPSCDPGGRGKSDPTAPMIQV